MATVDDGVNRWNVNRFNRVSFDFHEPRNSKRSETIAKRSKTPLKKSNSLMVLRTIDTIPVSTAPSLVDATTTDDVSSSSCSIDCSPVPTDSSSTGMGRRRRLPCLPSQEARQGMNGARVRDGGGRVTGLQRKHSWAWPSSSGCANQRLIGGVNHHRSIDGINNHPSVNQRPSVNHPSNDSVNNHRLIDGVNHHSSVNHRQLIDGANHHGNDVLADCLSNGASRLADENFNPLGNSVDQRQSDVVNHRLRDTVAQSPTVASNRHLNGAQSNFVSFQQQSFIVDKTSSNGHNFNSVRRHKSELTIHLQGHRDRNLEGTDLNHRQGQNGIRQRDNDVSHIQFQGDIEPSGGSINNGAKEMETCNASHYVPRHHSHNRNHFDGLPVNMNISKDDTLCRVLTNDCRNEIIDKPQCTNGDLRDLSKDCRNDCATAFKTASSRSHENGVERELDSNNQHEVLNLNQRGKIKPRKNEGGIHSSRDELNRRSNDENVGNKPMPSLSVESVRYGQEDRRKKLHTTTSLDETYSPEKREFQVSSRAPQRKASLDLKSRAQANETNSSDTISRKVEIGSRAKRERSPTVLQRQAKVLGSHLSISSSSLYNHEENLEDDHEVVSRNINRSQKHEHTFQRERWNSWKAENESSNYLIAPSQEKPNKAHPCFETCHPFVQSLPHNSSTLSSSNTVTNTKTQRTILTHPGANSPMQNGSSNRKHHPIPSKETIQEDTYHSPDASQINWTPSDAANLTSLHPSANRELSTTMARSTPSVPTLHTLLQTYQMIAVSLVKSKPMDDCGLKLISVPFMADVGPARFSPKGKRATKLGSPDGAFRTVAAVETNQRRDDQSRVVVVSGVEDGSVAADVADGIIEEGDIVIEVNGTYVLGSKLDAIERLLNQQQLNLVLAKPLGTTDPTTVNGCLPTNNDFNGIPQRTVLNGSLRSLVTPDQHHPTLEQPYRNGKSSPETSIDRRLKTIADRPTKLACSSKWSSQSEYTIRPIEADSAIRAKTGGHSEPDEAYYPSSESCEEVLDDDYGWQKISAV